MGKIFLSVLFCSILLIACNSHAGVNEKPTWHPAGKGLDGVVHALIEYKGDLYAGGWFDSIDGQYTRACVAKWNGTEWSNVSN
jgi:hypothetical protein